MSAARLIRPVIFSVICVIYLSQTNVKASENDKAEGLNVVTVATEDNDGFQRFLRSINKYNLKLEVLGMGKKWLGGDIVKYPGGGQKILLLKEFLEKVKDQKDLMIVFTDSYDVVFTNGAAELEKKFKQFDAKVVFSTEGFCWPDPGLSEQYPPVKPTEKRYLNSGGFMGYAPELYNIVSSSEVQNEDDDQLFYTKVFLDEAMRKKFSIKLDTRGDIFQNLNGALDEVQVKFKGATSYLYNTKTGNQPIVVHGNGPIKPQFNNIANYLGDAWTMTQGCQICKESTISLEGIKDEDLPKVFLALFLSRPIPFATEFFENVASLQYPKERMDLFVYYSNNYHDREVTAFMEKYGMKYNSAKLYSPENQLNDWAARNQALEDCVKADCQYYFALDGEVQIEDPTLLTHVIETNRSVVTPFFGRPGKLWTNFWGALSKDGFYKRADDYVEIVQAKKRGIWNVPYVAHAILIHGFRIPQIQGFYTRGDLDPDMSLAANLRDKNIFMYVDNQKNYGFLTNSDNFDTSHLHNDLYQIFDNQYAWEKKYIHPNYKSQLEEGFDFPQPCPDVFWLQMVTPTYCRQLIEEMEHFGQWSGGRDNYAPCPDVFWSPIVSDTYCQHLIEEMEHHGGWSGGRDNYQDARLEGGYENVPTVDIHMKQIDMEQHWLQFLKVYVAPLNQKIYTGYYTDSRAIMNFVVRYKPGEQDRLRPHHDASTYTINIALNRPGIDYEGGGVNFLRYNCTVTALKKGWMLMHPGRLTHIHEGLPTTAGTRYIMVSFIDP